MQPKVKVAHVQHRGATSILCLLESSSLPRETDPVIAAANKEVQKAKEQGQRRKRGSYHHYNDETCAKIAKYSCENSNKLLPASLTSLGMLLLRVPYAI